MRQVMIVYLGVLIFSSCADKNKVDGDWDDIIILSTKSVELTSSLDSVTITTGGDWWWINDVFFEDSIYEYYSRSDIDLGSGSFSIIEDQFFIERRDKNTLFVKISENSSGKVRSLTIYLEAGNYFDSVTIKQHGK